MIRQSKNTYATPLPRVALINGQRTQDGYVTGKVGSFTTPGLKYSFGLDPATGKLGCTCPAFKYGKGKLCKHLVSFAANLWEETK
jgi:hypothetical protein